MVSESFRVYPNEYLCWVYRVTRYRTTHNIYSKSTFHSIHKFINLHITLTVPVQHDTITLIESLSYYTYV